MVTKTLLNAAIRDEISRISELQGVDSNILENFAEFVLANGDRTTKGTRKKVSKAKSLSMTQLKDAIYKHFEVKNTTELKKSSAFKMATDGIDIGNFSQKTSWEELYRKVIGVLPHEEGETGYGCVNGVNIFKYFRPWQVFGLDAQSATDADIKSAYRNLSKVYHPDVPNTGDPEIFDRINTMYQSISAGA